MKGQIKLSSQKSRDMLTTHYELFEMKEVESIQEMHTKFTSITNDLCCLGEVTRTNKLVRKILNVLPASWKSKVNNIIEAKDLQILTMDELIRNLKTYELNKQQYQKRKEPKKEKSLAFKAVKNDSNEDDAEMTYITRRF